MADKKAVKTTEFAKESQAENPDASKAMVSLFGNAQQLPESMKGLKRMNLPTMIQPKDMPVGAVLDGEIIDFVSSPVKTVKGKLMWLKVITGEGDAKTVNEITFPVTGVIQSILAPDVEKKKDGTYDSKELFEGLKPNIGKRIVIVRRPDGYNKQYARSQYSFDVFLSEK